MKTTRPAGFTPEEWATLRNATDVDEEGEIQPKKKDGTGSSKDATPAESTKVNAPSAKRIKAMLKERWGGDQWLYNRGIRKNTSKVKNPVEGKFLADLDWTRIIVNPVDGSVLCMDSKRLQDLGASNVTLDEVYGILVVIYAWKFTPTEGLASIPKNDHDGEPPETMDDTCSESTMTGGNVSECTDELPSFMSGRTWQTVVDCPEGDYPKMPYVPAEEDHREKIVKVARTINAMVSRRVGRAEMLANTKAMTP